MQFPAWADSPKMTKAERASGRLRYILKDLALKKTGRQSMRSLATLVGLDHSTLCNSIRQGFFTEKTAAQIQLRLGEASVTVAMLTDPNGIKKTPG